jgi:hypothetical protein
MKKYIVFGMVLITSISLLSGCSTVKGIFGDSSKKEDKQANKVSEVQKAQNKNATSKMEQVAVLASGTDYALTKVTNKEPAVNVAQDINNRVISLSGKPNLNAEKEIWKTVDQLLSEIAAEKAKGAKSMSKKDEEITSLQQETKILTETKDAEIDKYMKLANDTALKADTYKSTLNQMDSWFGLGAVFYGVKKFIVSMAWILGSLGIIYLLLRAFAGTNPVVKAIFGIVEQVAAWFIHIIQGLAPRAASFANFIPKVEFDGYKQTLHKMIDTVELLQEKEKEGIKKYTLDELLVEFAKAMDQSDKDRVTEAKKHLNWK